jgi:hypothetical protein
LKNIVCVVFVTVVFAALAACDGVPGGTDRPSDFATLDKIKACWPDFNASNDMYPLPNEELDQEQKHQIELKSFADKLPPSNFKKSYENWAWFWQTQIDESREENRTHAKAKEYNGNDEVQRDLAKGATLKPPEPCCKNSPPT